MADSWKIVKNKATSVLLMTKTRGVNAKEKAYIRKLQFDVAQRQRAFGVEYLTLKQGNATPEDLQACIERAETEIAEIKESITVKESAIGANEEELKRQLSEVQ